MGKRLNLIKERENKSLTRNELADTLGISEIMVRKLESGARNPSPKMARRFAMFYQKELEYLFPDIFLIKFDTKHIKSKS